MPPKATNLTSSFSVNDAANEVQCPLRNQDGSLCRKRCLGEKRYRSMQEHIRRAHPEFYLPKLPATKESFELMINSPPHQVDPNHDPNHANHHHHAPHHQSHQNQISQHNDPSGLSPTYNNFGGELGATYEGYHALGGHDGGYYTAQDHDAQQIYSNMQEQQRTLGHDRRGSIIPTAQAAAALASLGQPGGYGRPDSSGGAWGDDMGQVNLFTYPLGLFHQSSPTNTEVNDLQAHYGTYGDIKDEHFNSIDPALDSAPFMPDHTAFSSTTGQDQPNLLQSSMAGSPDRNSMPLQRSLSRGGFGNRPRKSSLTQARLGKHERKKSGDRKRVSGDRKAFLGEPGSLRGTRWEDLIDAAASATEEEGSRDLTPIPGSPHQSPQVRSGTSIPPFHGLGSQFNTSFQASPLNRALTPPAVDHSGLAGIGDYPSVDSSISSHAHHNSADSGSNFHIANAAMLEAQSSPIYQQHNNIDAEAVHVYCAGCRRPTRLTTCHACTNCICALCESCTNAIIDEQSHGRMAGCPRCQVMDSAFKPFQIDIR